MITAFDNKVLTLFHGSHGGIVGSINAQSSRDLCDFGKGFYLEETVDLLMKYWRNIYEISNSVC